jgi:hypothetical protein
MFAICVSLAWVENTTFPGKQRFWTFQPLESSKESMMCRFLLLTPLVLGGLLLVSAESFGRGGSSAGGGSGGGRGGFGGYGTHGGRGYPATWGPASSGGSPTVVPASPAGSADAAASAATWQTCRYLRVKNNTGEKLTVYLQYRTWTTKRCYAWYPADPATSDQVLVFEIAPGAETDLYHDNWRINASRARLWAESATGEWNEYEGKDLWLVEADKSGEHYYYGDAMETFTFTFNP